MTNLYSGHQRAKESLKVQTNLASSQSHLISILLLHLNCLSPMTPVPHQLAQLRSTPRHNLPMTSFSPSSRHP